MRDIELLRDLFMETMGASFRLSPDEEEGWTIYLVKTKQIYKGTLEEVIAAAYEEIISYRTLRTDYSHVKKRHKPYDYR